MGMISWVRHAQASLGQSNYDQLSQRGWEQARQLGQHFAASGLAVDAVYTGTLRRHAQTLKGLRSGMAESGLAGGPACAALPEARVRSALDEYDSHALVKAVHPDALPPLDSPDAVKTHFRLLRQGLARWASGELTPASMPTFAQFSAALGQLLDDWHAQHARHHILVISSGGPIATATALALQAPPVQMIELNLRLRNASLTEMVSVKDGWVVQTFNTLPQLRLPQQSEWVTYA